MSEDNRPYNNVMKHWATKMTHHHDGEPEPSDKEIYHAQSLLLEAMRQWEEGQESYKPEHQITGIGLFLHDHITTLISVMFQYRGPDPAELIYLLHNWRKTLHEYIDVATDIKAYIPCDHKFAVRDKEGTWVCSECQRPCPAESIERLDYEESCNS